MSYTNIDRNLILRVRETIDGVTNSYTMNDLQSWTRTAGSSISYDTVSLSASTPMPYDILALNFFMVLKLTQDQQIQLTHLM